MKKINNEFIKYFDKIYKKDKNTFFKELENNLINNKKQFIITANPETIMVSEKNEELRNAFLDKETVVVADGIGVVKGAKEYNYPISETILGIDIAEKLIQLADLHNKKIFLFGAKPEILEKLKSSIEEKYKNCEIVGAVNGYVEDKNEVFKEIETKEPDIVLVALGIPLQECLIYKNIDKFKKGIFIGIGGSFDVLSGCKKRAPKIFIKLKLEWLYRITKEPKRLKRFYDNNIKYWLKIKRNKK